MLIGILNTLFEENLGRSTPLPVSGLDEVRAALSGFSVAAMGERCGIEADVIRQLARDFAGADKAVCYGRMGVSTQVFGTLCQWLVQLINLVSGNLDPGWRCPVYRGCGGCGEHHQRRQLQSLAKPGVRATGIWR